MNGKIRRLEDEVGMASEEILMLAFERLDPTAQVIIALYYRRNDHFNNRAIALQLGLDVGTVQSIKRAAIAQLRRSIHEISRDRREKGLKESDSSIADYLEAHWEDIEGRIKSQETSSLETSDNEPLDEDVRLCREERAKRGIVPLQQHLCADGHPDRRFGTWLGCPECGCETVILGRIRKGGCLTASSRKARCAQCGHQWWTKTREAFGGTRQVEVRG